MYISLDSYGGGVYMWMPHSDCVHNNCESYSCIRMIMLGRSTELMIGLAVVASTAESNFFYKYILITGNVI